MKEAELRKHCVCDICRERILQSGLPLFWRVTVERFGIDMQAVSRQHGLGMMIGAPLAQIMGPDEDLAKPVMDTKVLTVCENCAIGAPVAIGEIAMRG